MLLRCVSIMKMNSSIFTKLSSAIQINLTYNLKRNCAICSWRFFRSNTEIRTSRIQIGKKLLGFRNMQEKLENGISCRSNTKKSGNPVCNFDWTEKCETIESRLAQGLIFSNRDRKGETPLMLGFPRLWEIMIIS